MSLRSASVSHPTNGPFLARKSSTGNSTTPAHRLIRTNNCGNFEWFAIRFFSGYACLFLFTFGRKSPRYRLLCQWLQGLNESALWSRLTRNKPSVPASVSKFSAEFCVDFRLARIPHLLLKIFLRPRYILMTDFDMVNSHAPDWICTNPGSSLRITGKTVVDTVQS